VLAVSRLTMRGAERLISLSARYGRPMEKRQKVERPQIAEIQQRRREPAASEGRSIAINAASDIEMGFVVHVELPSMAIDRLSNFTQQFVALRWLHHPVVRLRP
jgi:hypothetical protein